MHKFPLWRTLCLWSFLGLTLTGYTNIGFAQEGLALSDAEKEALGLSPEPTVDPVEPPPLPQAPKEQAPVVDSRPAPPVSESAQAAPEGPDPTTEPTSKKADDTPVAETPSPPEPGSPALPPPQVSGDPDPETQDDSIKLSPTESAESYAEARMRRLEEKSKAHWTTSFFYTHKAFPDADWRARQYSGNVKNPRFWGLTFQAERILFHGAGLWALGAEFSVFGRPTADRFKHPFPAILALGAFASYNAQFNIRQWVVPFIKGGIDGTRYGYTFDSDHIQGVRALPRADAGLHIYLNFLDQSSAGEMYGNYGILRSYLTAAYSISADRTKKDVNLSDRAIRVGFRLEY